MDSEWLEVAQAARQIGCEVGIVHRWINEGLLPCKRVRHNTLTQQGVANKVVVRLEDIYTCIRNASRESRPTGHESADEISAQSLTESSRRPLSSREKEVAWGVIAARGAHDIDALLVDVRDALDRISWEDKVDVRDVVAAIVGPANGYKVGRSQTPHVDPEIRARAARFLGNPNVQFAIAQAAFTPFTYELVEQNGRADFVQRQSVEDVPLYLVWCVEHKLHPHLGCRWPIDTDGRFAKARRLPWAVRQRLLDLDYNQDWVLQQDAKELYQSRVKFAQLVWLYCLDRVLKRPTLYHQLLEIMAEDVESRARLDEWEKELIRQEILYLAKSSRLRS